MSDDTFDHFDDMAERTIWPWCDDESHDSDDEQGWNEYDSWDEDYDDSMDGDHDSAMDSIGWGDDDSLAYGGGGEDF